MKTMPELPEVETVCTALASVVTGKKVARLQLFRPDLRWPIPEGLAARVEGQLMGRPWRRGKYIIMPTGQTGSLLLHLGMSGHVRISQAKPDFAKHDHIAMQLLPAKAGGPAGQAGSWWVFCDPRRFGHLDWLASGTEADHWLLKGMGIEPLSNEFSPAYLESALANRQSAIKTALLDQRLIAGLGNIYVSEALFRAGISPRRKAASIRGQRAMRLAAAVRAVLQEAIEQGGTSLRDHRQPNGEIGYFVQKLRVYGKQGQPCPSCDAPIKLLRQAGRSGFYCPSCQR